MGYCTWGGAPVNPKGCEGRHQYESGFVFNILVSRQRRKRTAEKEANVVSIIELALSHIMCHKRQKEQDPDESDCF